MAANPLLVLTLAKQVRKHRGLILIAVIAVLLTACAPLLAVAGLAVLTGATPAPPNTAAAAAVAGIPDSAATAYQHNANRCPGLDWTLLAAVGEVESNHGTLAASQLDPTTGQAQPWIFGPPLNGQAGTAAIPVGQWAGWWGLTGPWTQAVGPMQFLPATFEANAVDGDGDTTTNPHQIDDAVATTANYLCTAGGGDIDGAGEIARIYNPGSSTYADQLAEAQQRITTAAAASDQQATTGSATACPVAGPINFTDTWGAPRSGGRSHQGVDIFAPAGTPVLAPASGTVEHGSDSLGGLAYRLTADDGTYYYGAHLSAYANENAGWVPAGTVIGYVGNTGDAASTPSHLHWQIHPGGRGSEPTNPTPTAEALCN